MALSTKRLAEWGALRTYQLLRILQSNVVKAFVGSTLDACGTPSFTTWHPSHVAFSLLFFFLLLIPNNLFNIIYELSFTMGSQNPLWVPIGSAMDEVKLSSSLSIPPLTTKLQISYQSFNS